ncbi:response regulator transcription factor [Nocardia iowensis]|uniref:LuxR C-terminal-related transcriptional regulator n=1 Tax=Nocardia iowensis TaxID=204891 RepID=A0ABX8RFN9_NOCIO|nr:LuxR C-terminal-related transcriptional regulator [Nocardia iowensis]QXN88408.1 LuxR C-terminal-related transcriptional regulator [Nocardia iowensis]
MTEIVWGTTDVVDIAIHELVRLADAPDCHVGAVVDLARRQAQAWLELARILEERDTTDPAVPDADHVGDSEELPPAPPLTVLTERQREIAELVATGMTNRMIARRLGLSEWTVVNHLRQVMVKLDCPSRLHVALIIQRDNQPAVLKS